MAFFSKLFEKKECAICGGEIGLLGNRKLEDGNCCKNCAAKLSPWFSERRQSTVEDIKAQLEYREANQEKVAAFHATRTLGESMKVILDEDAGKFIVTSARNWQSVNPDVLSFSDVTGWGMAVWARVPRARAPTAISIIFFMVFLSPCCFRWFLNFRIKTSVVRRGGVGGA